jgi:hypothetical protein
MPVLIDPATGLPIEPALDALQSEGLSSATDGDTSFPGTGPESSATNEAAGALQVAALDPSALLKLASSLRSERIARFGEDASLRVGSDQASASVQHTASMIEDLLSLYPLSATLGSGGKKLAIIAGESVELDQRFGPHGLILREVGWDSVFVEYQGQRHLLHMPGFRSAPVSAAAAEQSAALPTEPRVP